MSLFMGLRSQECQHGRIFQKRQQRAATSQAVAEQEEENPLSLQLSLQKLKCGCTVDSTDMIRLQFTQNAYMIFMWRAFIAKGKWPANGQRQPSKYPFKFQASVFRSLPWNSLQASIITSCKLPVEQRWQES